MARVGKNKDRMESAGIEFQEKVRRGYLELAKAEPKRIRVFDSRKTTLRLAEPRAVAASLSNTPLKRLAHVPYREPFSDSFIAA